MFRGIKSKNDKIEVTMCSSREKLCMDKSKKGIYTLIQQVVQTERRRNESSAQDSQLQKLLRYHSPLHTLNHSILSFDLLVLMLSCSYSLYFHLNHIFYLKRLSLVSIREYLQNIESVKDVMRLVVFKKSEKSNKTRVDLNDVYEYYKQWTYWIV